MANDKDVEKMKDKIGKLKFEAALARLEAIVEKLESEDVDLEGSLVLYDEAKLLGEHCGKLLDDAEDRVKAVDESGELTDFE
jgi:exodeoxyribonuclease VII small subunit